MEELVTKKEYENIYKGKNVLITGHTGFKGSWLSVWLRSLGANVSGYALPAEYENFIYDSADFKQDSYLEDIRDFTTFNAVVQKTQPDFIFHMAAQPLVRKSFEIPAETFDVNVVGTANVLQALIKLPRKCTCIIITTDKVYENQETEIYYKENDRLGGFDPYSSSKACAELVTDSFRNSFFNMANYGQHQKTIISARAGNVIGGGDFSKDRLLPDIVRGITAGQEIQVRNPKSVRPWQHVLEALSGYLLAAALANLKPEKYSGAYNFGPDKNDHLTVEEIVTTAIQIFKKGSYKISTQNNAPHEATLLHLDTHKAKNLLNWQPVLSAHKSLEWTIEWYKVSNENKMEFTLEQIKQYTSL